MATIRDRYVLEVDTSGAQSGISGLNGGIGGLMGSIRGLGPLIAGAAAGLAAFGAVSAIQDTINDFDELAKRARAVGAANEESFQSFQVLTNFLGEAGIAAGETDAILRRLQNATAQADAGVESFADIFDKLGDRVRDANGEFLDSPALFEEVARAVQDGTLSMAEATQLFGRSAGPELVNILQEMAENGTSVSEALQDVAQHTNIVDIEAARNAEAFNDNIGRLKQGIGQLMTDAISPLLPILVQLTEQILANAPAVIEGVRSAFEALSPVFQLIGTVLTDLVFPILGQVFELLGALFGVIAPIYETAIPLLTAGFEAIVGIIQAVVGAIVGLVERLGEVGARARELRDSVTGAFGDMAEGVTSRARAAADGVTGWFSQMYDDLWGNSIIPDLIEGVTGGFEDMSDSIEGETQGTVANIRNGFASIFGTVASGLGNTIRTGTNEARNVLGEFGGVFRNIVGNIANDSRSATGNIADALDIGTIGDDLLEGINIGLDDFRDKIEGLDIPLSAYKTTTEEINTVLEETQTLYQALNEDTTEYIELTENLNEILETEIDLYESLAENIEEYRTVLEETVEQLNTQLESFENLTEANELLEEQYQSFNETIKEATETVIAAIEQTDLNTESNNQLNSAVESLISTVNAYMNALNQKIQLTAQAIQANQQLADSYRQIEQQALAAAQAQSQLSSRSGAGGGLMGLLGNFAGFFADGGFIPRGQFGIVGERGPELVSGPAQITPLDQMGGSVTYNINAVDARSFQELLASDPGLIHALAIKGGLRIPGRR
jgi:TP901 family phage tail tape measure protein